MQGAVLACARLYMLLVSKVYILGLVVAPHHHRAYHRTHAVQHVWRTDHAVLCQYHFCTCAHACAPPPLVPSKPQVAAEIHTSELGNFGHAKNWVALAILVLMLVAIGTEKVHRMWCAFVAAFAMMSLLLWCNMTPSLAKVCGRVVDALLDTAWAGAHVGNTGWFTQLLLLMLHCRGLLLPAHCLHCAVCVLLSVSSPRLHWPGIVCYLHILAHSVTVLLYLLNPQVTEFLDESTLGLLFGMMILVGKLKDTGLFEVLCAWTLRASKGRMWALSLLMMYITGESTQHWAHIQCET
jgi:hypothetical protein